MPGWGRYVTRLARTTGLIKEDEDSRHEPVAKVVLQGEQCGFALQNMSSHKRFKMSFTLT